MDVWVDRELNGRHFPGVRLKSRMGKLLKSLGDKTGDSLPTACQDWAATKAAYRFIDNERVSEKAILGGHFQATRERFASAEGPPLVLHDTTEFSYTRSDTQAIVKTHKVTCGQKDSKGRQRMHTVCGLLMHSILVVTPEGLPLGPAAITPWARMVTSIEKGATWGLKNAPEWGENARL